MAIRPFANAPHADKNSIAVNWLIGVQTGNTPNAVNQMKYLTVDEFTAYVRSTYGSMWNYRGDFSSATPTDPEVNDYFVCTGNFTEDGQSFVSGHVYAYNGNTWGDVSNVFLQYVKQSDFETLSDDVDGIDDRLTEAEQKIDAMTGMVFKGDTTRAELPSPSASNQNWVYYLTDESIYVASNGTQWVTVMNYVVQNITEGDTTHAPSGDAVYNEFETLHESIKTLSEWDNHSDTDMVFEGELGKTWEDMENQIPLAENDATADVAEIAIKARQDEDGNDIVETYALKTDVEALTQRVSANSKRITNLELKTGDQFDVDYPSDTYGMDGVPANVEPYAKVTKLRGVGRVGNNLIRASAMPPASGYGITITPNSDGSITVSGTATGGNAVYTLYSVVNTAKTYLWGGCPSGGSTSTFYIGTSTSYADVGGGMLRTFPSSGAYNINLTILEGTTVNFTFKPFLVDLAVYFGITDLSFLGATDSAKLATIQKNYPELLIPSDYGTSVVFPTYSAVKSDPAGKNFMDISQYGLYELVAGTSRYGLKRRLPAGTYTISGKASSGQTYTVGAIVNDSISSTNNVVDTFSHTITLSAEGYIAIWINNNVATLDWIMLNTGSSALPWEAYMTDTLTLPTPVTLKGAGSVAEEYFPETGRITHPIGSYTFTGQETWNASDNYYRTNIADSTILQPANDTIVPNILVADFIPCEWKTTADKAVYVGPKNIITDNNKIWFRDTSGKTAEQFAQYMAGKTIYYELATPSADTFVDPILDPYVEVEPNGTVKPVQSQSPEVDSAMTVEYMAS